MRSPGQWRKARRYHRQAAILNILRYSDKSAWEIAQRFGRLEWTVTRDLARLVELGCVESHWEISGCKVYQLKSAQPTSGPAAAGDKASRPRYLHPTRGALGPWWKP